MKLLDQEQKLYTTGVITVTSLRVVHEEGDHIVQIPIAHVDSIQLRRTHHPQLLYWAVVSALLGGTVDYWFYRTSRIMETPYNKAGLIVAFVCVFLYLASRRHWLEIRSTGGALIREHYSSGAREALLSVFNVVTAAGCPERSGGPDNGHGPR